MVTYRYQMSSDLSPTSRDQNDLGSNNPERRVVWPPKLILQTPMGYLRDCM